MAEHCCGACESGQPCAASVDCAAISARVLEIDALETVWKVQLQNLRQFHQLANLVAQMDGQPADPGIGLGAVQEAEEWIRDLARQRQELVAQACASCPDSEFC